METLRIATRGSALARAQTELAIAALHSVAAVDTEVLVIRTSGDRSADVPAAQMEGQGWFTAELERALLDGRADAAVHSAKDLPTQLAAGLAIVAHLERGDARDALVTRDALATLDTLRPGASVGTSSPRREAFLHALRPDLRAVPIRGNVDTRLRKLDAGEVDALLLAAAGLDRLGLGERATERLDPRRFVPAPAQGVIAIEAREGSPAAAACAPADHAQSGAAVHAERAVLAELGGGCRLPLGAWARVEAEELVLLAAIAVEEPGVGFVLRSAELSAPLDRDPRALGVEVAAGLRS